MKRLTLVLMILVCVSASAQKPIRIYSTYAESRVSHQLMQWMEKGGCKTTFGGRNTGRTIYVGLTPEMKSRYRPLIDSLRDDGYFILGNGRDVVLYGAGEKGTLYAVYAFLEMVGFRLYTPEAMVVPDLSQLQLPRCRIVSNPAFAYRDVEYYYPNHSQLYADWHHLHTKADRDRLFGMYVHTFNKLLPTERYFDSHPDWYSLNNGRRSRDGQLCLANPQVLEELCKRLADTISAFPTKKVWSVSPNDNYNACECPACRRLDSLYGGQSGTLLWFVNQVARRFPDKTIATLAYQYTRQAPVSSAGVRPDTNVLVMLCPIETGRQAPVGQADPSFRKDMEDWSRLTDNIYLWDYIVQFRNFWNPFPNLHVLQPNLQFFKEHGARMIFEQASGADNISSWMDIRCYMTAKLMWNPYLDLDSLMADFYQGYYGAGSPYVKQIVDTMTATLVASGRRLDIYGFPVDGLFYEPGNPHVGYLYPTCQEHYYDLLRQAEGATRDSTLLERLRFFRLALDFAHLESNYGDPSGEEMLAEIDSLERNLEHFSVPQMMEMGCTPVEYAATMRHWVDKAFSPNLAYDADVYIRHQPRAPYNEGTLSDGLVGIMDYRNTWLGFWGDTLDAVVDLRQPTEIRSIALDFYFYPLSWIFNPQWVLFQVSDDGELWQPFGDLLRPENPEVLAKPEIHTLRCELTSPQTARYVRVVAAPLPEIPSWHRAAGQKPWIFTDEIIIR